MKGLLLSIICLIGFHQTSKAQRIAYKPFDYEAPVTVQVVPTIINYEGVKFGFGIGVNLKQTISINYFHLRDYDDRDSFYDNRYSGVHINASVPVWGNIEIGPSVRFATMNAVWQKPSWGAEIRWKFSKSFRLGLEQGVSGSHLPIAVKMIFNLY